MSAETARYFLHESSYVDQPADIGTGTKIWHFSHVLAGSRIGADCVLGQNVVVGPNVTIGDRVRIQNNVSIYEGVTLEDDVFCGPSCVFTNVDRPRSAFPTDRARYAKTLVRHGATIGANATIVCGHTLGAHSFVGAGSVVTQDVPDYAVVYGNPARVHGWACECGARLLFKGVATACETCGRTYVQKAGRIVEEGAQCTVRSAQCREDDASGCADAGGGKA